jgi:hypothetical protein
MYWIGNMYRYAILFGMLEMETCIDISALTGMSLNGHVLYLLGFRVLGFLKKKKLYLFRFTYKNSFLLFPGNPSSAFPRRFWGFQKHADSLESCIGHSPLSFCETGRVRILRLCKRRRKTL